MTNFSFCSGPFWDVDLVWNSSQPDFSPCFQSTVLSWLPTILLLLLAPFDIFKKGPGFPLRLSFLNVSKVVLTVSLVVVVVVESILVWQQGDRVVAPVLGPSLEALGYLLSLFLLYKALR